VGRSDVSTAIVGVGNIGTVVARQLVAGGEPVVLASKDDARAESLAEALGLLARAAAVDEALSSADAVVFAVWFDTMRELTDDGVAEAVIDRLIRSAGFDPLKVGGVDDAGRIKAPGGDLQGALLDHDQARTTINRKDTF
jgi:predicted dinucleotide-binding enzyme